MSLISYISVAHLQLLFPVVPTWWKMCPHCCACILRRPPTVTTHELNATDCDWVVLRCFLPPLPESSTTSSQRDVRPGSQGSLGILGELVLLCAIISVTFSALVPSALFIWVQIKLFSWRTKCSLSHWGSCHGNQLLLLIEERDNHLKWSMLFSQGVLLFHPLNTVWCCALKRLALVNGPINSSCTISKSSNRFYSPFVRHACVLLCSVYPTTFLTMKCCCLLKRKVPEIFLWTNGVQ